MRHVFVIESRTPIEPIRERLQQEAAFLESEGARLKMQADKLRFFYSLRCELDFAATEYGIAESRVLGQQCVANALAEVLVEDWLRPTLGKLLTRHFESFSEAEQAAIIDRAVEKLNGVAGDTTWRQRRKCRVREALANYLATTSEIHLDGFLSFRLRSYMQELEEALYHAIEQFLTERDYTEFVHLLRGFAQVIEPKQTLVHVLMSSPREFEILDDRGQTLYADLIETVIMGETQEMVGYEDQLLSSLLTLSPRQIVLHANTFRTQPDLRTTIEDVFGARVRCCDGCDLCNHLASLT